jgi:hypothetical protein
MIVFVGMGVAMVVMVVMRVVIAVIVVVIVRMVIMIMAMAVAVIAIVVMIVMMNFVRGFRSLGTDRLPEGDGPNGDDDQERDPTQQNRHVERLRQDA